MLYHYWINLEIFQAGTPARWDPKYKVISQRSREGLYEEIQGQYSRIYFLMPYAHNIIFSY